jgi:hypothetical protein
VADVGAYSPNVLERLSEKDLEVVWSAGAEGQKQRERRFLAPLVASWKPGMELIWTFQTVSRRGVLGSSDSESSCIHLARPRSYAVCILRPRVGRIFLIIPREAPTPPRRVRLSGPGLGDVLGAQVPRG